MRRFAIVLAACGSSQHTGPAAEPPAPAVRTYAPLTIRSDAKAPRQALLLATDDAAGSTVLPLPGVPATVTVDAMTGRLGVTPLHLAIAPNTDATVHVAGDAWQASLVAATVLDKDVTDYLFSVSPRLAIDEGPIAAAGLLAALTGAAIAPGASVAGTLDPDGTIAPVAGLPERFLGAIAKGKKRLGYPLGMRVAKSDSGDSVDLVELAKARGAEAIEIGDVRDAYALLTGKHLPAPVPVAEADMALDPATADALESRYKDWQAKIAVEWATIVQLDTAGRLPQVLGLLRDYAKRGAADAEQLHKQGNLAAAFNRLLVAWGYASTTGATYDILSKVQAGDVTGAITVLDARATYEADARAAFEKIAALQPATLGGHLQVLSAFESVLAGWGYEPLASAAIANAKRYLETLAGKPRAELGSPEVADAVVKVIGPTLVYVTRTRVGALLAVQELELAGAQDLPYVSTNLTLRRLASAYAAAGAAELASVDALVVEPLAKSAKLTPDDARDRFAIAEPDYLVAAMASRLGADSLPHDLEAAWGTTSQAWGLLEIAGGELSYECAAKLAAKYYALGVQPDADDPSKIDRLDNANALRALLETAERTARQNAHAARIAAGLIPVRSKLLYQLAMFERDGDLADKLDALGLFWEASAMAQTAVMLARN